MAATQVRIGPVHDWGGLRSLRAQIEQGLSDLPGDLCRELAMVGAELVENGLRHGDQKPEGVVVELERAPGFVELCVTTRLSAAERARAVLQRVRAVEAEPDKERAYVERLLVLAKNAVQRTSELGFHRIAAEGRCSLRAAHEGERLTICARRAL